MQQDDDEARPAAVRSRSGQGGAASIAATPSGSASARAQAVTLGAADPAGGAQAPERADAARNRAQILAAAERLFSETDPRTVTMGQIAKAAGVGRATLYRRFDTPSAVAVALLDEHERRLQEQMMWGPPPLGPGAEPAERLAAFYLAMVDLLERHLPLVLGAETGAERFTTGAYGFWRTHVRALLAEAGTHDPEALIEVVLGPLAPEVYHHQRTELGLSPERIGRALGWAARRMLAPQGPEGGPLRPDPDPGGAFRTPARY